MTPDVGYTPAVTMPESSVRDEGSVTRISRPRYLPGRQPPIAARHTYRNSPGSLFRPGAGLLLAMVVALCAGCRDAPKTAERPPEPVKVAAVVQRDVPIFAEWVGTTVGYVTAQLGRLVAYVQLYKALGGGWNLKDPQLPPSTAEAQEPAACADKKC